MSLSLSSGSVIEVSYYHYYSRILLIPTQLIVRHILQDVSNACPVLYDCPLLNAMNACPLLNAMNACPLLNAMNNVAIHLVNVNLYTYKYV